MIGRAIAYGAGTIVNAIATGRGAAFGVRLWTKATVRLTDEPGVVSGRILSEPGEGTALLERAASVVLRAYGVEGVYGAYVETDSNIPIARGLKSSSVAANAIVLATIGALGKRPRSDLWAIGLAVKAAIEAGVTVTGAFDDACASYFGGVVVTDNLRREIVRRLAVTEELAVLFLVARRKVYTVDMDVKRLRGLAPLVDAAYEEACKGRFWDAMTLNGLVYSAAIGYDPAPAFDALDGGAVAAGLSGTGPSIAAIVPPDRVDEVLDRWQAYEGDVIETRINAEKARIEGGPWERSS